MLNNKWNNVLNEEFSKEYFQNLSKFIDEEYASKEVYPNKKDIFKALNLVDYDEVKVVIIGQDPYHGPNEAQGLSFSVPSKIKRPPSLNNIFKELHADLGYIREKNDLSDWAESGVLLLNTILTVVKDTPLSHKDCGWEIFTDAVIKAISSKDKPVVFILWGKHAQTKKNLIDERKHFIVESPHPSPFSAHRGFFGSKPFSKTNELLIKTNQKPIEW